MRTMRTIFCTPNLMAGRTALVPYAGAEGDDWVPEAPAMPAEAAEAAEAPTGPRWKPRISACGVNCWLSPVAGRHA
jgi:hypothetical protein